MRCRRLVADSWSAVDDAALDAATASKTIAAGLWSRPVVFLTGAAPKALVQTTNVSSSCTLLRRAPGCHRLSVPARGEWVLMSRGVQAQLPPRRGTTARNARRASSTGGRSNCGRVVGRLVADAVRSSRLRLARESHLRGRQMHPRRQLVRLARRKMSELIAEVSRNSR